MPWSIGKPGSKEDRNAQGDISIIIFMGHALLRNGIKDKAIFGEASSRRGRAVNGMSPNVKTRTVQRIMYIKLSNEGKGSLCNGANDPRTDRAQDG